MVYSRQKIQGLDEQWFIIVDLWKSYASITHSRSMYADFLLDSSAGAGKSVLWYVVISPDAYDN